MSNARNLARVLADTSGAIAATNLANAVPADGSITAAKLASGAVTDAKVASGLSASKISGALAKDNMASGSVLQVVSVSNTTRSATSCPNTGADIPSMSVTITPQFSTSKILILVNLAYNAPENEGLVGRLLRNGTIIGNNTSGPGVAGFYGIATANDGNYRLWSSSANYLDSPNTTSAVTYKLQAACVVSGSRTLYLNGNGRNYSTDATGASNITAMEIAA